MISTNTNSTSIALLFTGHRRKAILRIVALTFFPLLIVLFALIYYRDPVHYVDLLREDGPVEWLTFASLFLAGLMGLDITLQIRQRHKIFHWFFLVFGLFCLVMAMEEISWGQRLFALSSPQYFLSHSDQQEINVHNVLQTEIGLKTKDLSGIVLFGYGFVLPWLMLSPWLAGWLRRLRFVVPPRYLSLGFLIATLFMADRPTGFEEEIGEMAFGFCFLLFMIHELLSLTPDNAIQPFDLPEIRLLRWTAALERGVLAGLTLLAVALRFWHMDGQGLWLREASYWALVQAPQTGMYQLRDLLPPHWPGWLYGQSAWSQLAGTSEYALRFLAGMAGILAVPLLWQLLRSIWPDQRLLRIIATLLLTISPAAVAYSQELSDHSFVLVLALFSMQLTIWLMRRPVWWVNVGWLLVNGLLVVFTPVSALLVLAEVCAYGGHLMRGKAVAGSWIVPIVGAAFALYMLALWVGNVASGTASFLGPGQNIDADGNTLTERLNLVWLQLNFAHVLYGSAAKRLALPLFLLLVCGLYFLFTHRPNQLDRLAPASSFNINWLLVGILALTALFVGATKPDQSIIPAVYAVPAVIILLALGIVLLWESVRLVGLFALLLSLGISAAVLFIYFDGANHGYIKSDYRAVARSLQARATNADSILLLGPQQLPLAAYYLAGLAPAQPVPPVEQGDLGLLPSPKVVPEEVDDDLRASIAKHPNVWLVQYEDGISDPGSFVVDFLNAIAYKADCPAWFDVGYCRFISPTFYQPQMQSGREALYNQKFLLEATGVTVEPSSQTLLVETDWHALERPDLDYKYSVRLIGGDGAVLLQEDEFPIGPLLPPTTWNAGDRKPGYLTLPLQGQPPGTYQVELIVYDPATLHPVPLTLAGEALDDKPLFLANVQIGADGSIAVLN